jgi:hypothetical protein
VHRRMVRESLSLREAHVSEGGGGGGGCFVLGKHRSAARARGGVGRVGGGTGEEGLIQSKR